MCYVNFNSLNRDVYIKLHNSNMNDVYNNYVKKLYFLIGLCMEIFCMTWGKYYISIALLLSPFPL